MSPCGTRTGAGDRFSFAAENLAVLAITMGFMLDESQLSVLGSNFTRHCADLLTLIGRFSVVLRCPGLELSR